MTTPSTTKTKRSENQDQPHEFHCFGDLELRTTDKIIFKVFSQRLQAVSSVFKSMMEIGNQISSTGNKRKTPPEADVIDVGFHSTTLATFLDMINVPNPSPLETDFPSSLRLYEFCDKFDIAAKLKDVVKKRLFQCITTTGAYAWDLLIWSADHDDINMAKEALSRMSPQTFTYPQLTDENGNNARVSIDFWSAMSKLPVDWQNCILRLATRAGRSTEDSYRYSYEVTYHLQVTADWTSVAAKFKTSG